MGGWAEIVSSTADPYQLAARGSMERLTQLLKQEACAMPPAKGRNMKTINYLPVFEKATCIIINYISVICCNLKSCLNLIKL